MPRRLAARAFHRQGLTFNRRRHLRSRAKIRPFSSGAIRRTNIPKEPTGKLKKSRKFAGKSREKRKGKERQDNPPDDSQISPAPLAPPAAARRRKENSGAASRAPPSQRPRCVYLSPTFPLPVFFPPSLLPLSFLSLSNLFSSLSPVFVFYQQLQL